ncbi:MAG: hypothetical protein WKF89_10300 [Chitinophagaceae bacterium]
MFPNTSTASTLNGESSGNPSDTRSTAISLLSQLIFAVFTWSFTMAIIAPATRLAVVTL